MHRLVSLIQQEIETFSFFHFISTEKKSKKVLKRSISTKYMEFHCIYRQYRVKSFEPSGPLLAELIPVSVA